MAEKHKTGWVGWFKPVAGGSWRIVSRAETEAEASRLMLDAGCGSGDYYVLRAEDGPPTPRRLRIRGPRFRGVSPGHRGLFRGEAGWKGGHR